MRGILFRRNMMELKVIKRLKRTIYYNSTRRWHDLIGEEMAFKYKTLTTTPQMSKYYTKWGKKGRKRKCREKPGIRSRTYDNRQFRKIKKEYGL